MNTLTGKSVGIALLMAAALLAALFAMGVFAPAGVDALVKSGSKEVKITLSDSAPDAKGVEMTITFELDEGINAATQNVEIDLPVAAAASATLFGLPNDFASTATTPSAYVSVMQGRRNVGSVTRPCGRR